MRTKLSEFDAKATELEKEKARLIEETATLQEQVWLSFFWSGRVTVRALSVMEIGGVSFPWECVVY